MDYRVGSMAQRARLIDYTPAFEKQHDYGKINDIDYVSASNRFI